MNDKQIAGPQTLPPILENLAEHPFLQGLDPRHLSILAECAMQAYFNPGEIIFREGDPANRFYLLRSGKVCLEASDESSSKVVQTIGGGDVLGWSWLYAPYGWHFTARAITPCRAVELNAASLLIRAEEDRAFGYELMNRLSKHLIQRLQSTRKRLICEVKMRNGSD